MLREYLESLAIAVFIALLIRLFVVSAYRIPTTSMWPTLQVGDFVFAFKLPYGLRVPFIEDKIFVSGKPTRGQVVVFRYPSDPQLSYVKRVVAIQGDKIEIKRKRLYINDQPAEYIEVERPKALEAETQGFSVMKETVLGSTRTVLFTPQGDSQNYGPKVVPPGQFFVLGDNRDSSDDSRYWGMVPVENIDGRVFTIWLSLDWQQPIGGMPQVRWDRILASIQ